VQEDLPNPYQWNGAHGYYYDADVGMYLLGLRWYEPYTGRFLTPDPIGFSGDEINLYRYVANNPVNAIDSLGLNGTGNTLNPLSPPARVELRRDENGNLILAPAPEAYASGFKLTELGGFIYPSPQFSHGRTFSDAGNLTNTPVYPQPVDLRGEVWPYIRGTLFVVGGILLMAGGLVMMWLSVGVASGPGISAVSAGVAWFHGGVAVLVTGFLMTTTADKPAQYPHNILWHPMMPVPGNGGTATQP
jgi:RHS repeat-associated protein